MSRLGDVPAPVCNVGWRGRELSGSAAMPMSRRASFVLVGGESCLNPGRPD